MAGSRARGVAIALIGALLSSTAWGRGAAPARLTLPLRLRVARCDGKPVRDRAWVDAQVAAARRIYARHAIALDVLVEGFSPARCALLDRAQRDSLAADVAMDGRVTVLVVRRVRDLDVPSYDLMGVHWRYRGRDRRLAGRRWVYLTWRARPPVLAHELAHYLGLAHDRRGGNLMTPGPSDPAWRQARRPSPFRPRFSPQQARRLRRAVERLGAKKGRAVAAPRAVTGSGT